MWWMWVVGGLAAWVILGTVLALVIGRSIHLADLRSASGARSRDLAGAAVASIPPARSRRRAVPLPPVGVGLAAVAVALEASGYALRLSGSTGSTAELFSMDAPFSVPRMFVALLFAAAALAAVAGASALPGRRTWWLAVGLVSGVIAAVKAGSTVHSDALGALSDAVGASMAVLVSAGVAAACLVVLWVLSRHDRRDRRRVVGILALYAAASVGLSAVSSVAAGMFGGASSWAVGATFVEEAGEALAGVALLVAVLVGVAPRLVLPRDWALRRAADAATLQLPTQAPGRPVLQDPATR
jgi:hypothetical protein